MEPGEAPVRGKPDTVVAGLWFHQLRAGSRSGGQRAALATRAGEAPAGSRGPRAGEDPGRQSLACQPQGLCPTPSKTAKGAPPDLPATSTDSREAEPGHPPAQGASSSPPPPWTLLGRRSLGFPALGPGVS